ncbi:hypothetical protein L1987_21532 [Smallanthus sonchifolius]|uniref:Uncharacterized protein n=1 Tax=Smallanthus sonchifolius TaxID=185202 RepID=A0ACB9IUW9_9ASTR|nr:hypothetical protein L1987_21532 [Smallanthus sonchifolius]
MTHSHDFLLCDEVWDTMSPVPSSDSPHDHHIQPNHHHHNNLIHRIMDFKHSFDTYVQKEIKYMTGSGYVNRLQSNHFVTDCRLKAIRWFIHCQRRFNFCIGTVFNALNYVDRFFDMNKCHGWSYSMMELLSLASLSIAIKFGETCPPSLREIQEGLEYCFEAKLIQKMELKVLRSLGWELNSITPYSYVELIEWELNNQFKPIARTRLDEILLASSLDAKLLAYRPCVIAISGLKCILEDENSLSHITSFIPEDQKQNIESCYNMMQEILVGHHNPSSPDTVLTKELQVPIHVEQIDLSFIDGQPATNDNLIKRNRRVDDGDGDGDGDDCGLKACWVMKTVNVMHGYTHENIKKGGI